MSFARTQQTAALIIAARRLKIAKHRRRVPRQIPPRRIEDKYAQRMREFVVPRVRAAFSTFTQEIPYILSSAHAGMRLDSLHPRFVHVRKRLEDLRLDVGEGTRIRELINQAREHMQKTVMTADLENLASLFASNTATYQKQQFARQTKAALGIDPFIQDKRLMPLTQAFVDANVGFIKGLTDDTASRIEKSALTAIQDGTLWTDFQDDLEKSFGFSESRSELIARDQTGKLYGQLNASRQRELGVDKFIWRTSEDERVRDEHEALDGETFSYDEPPDEGLPGEPIMCRCTAEPDFSSILDATDDAPDETPADDRQPESDRNARSFSFADRGESPRATPAQQQATQQQQQLADQRRIAQAQLGVASTHVSEHEAQRAIEELEAAQRLEREQFGIGMGRIVGNTEHDLPFTEERKKPIDVMNRTTPTLAPAEPILELPDLPPEPKPIELPTGWQFTKFNGATYVHVPGEKGTLIPYREVKAGNYSLTPRPPVKRGFFSRLLRR
jgi:SPP1 gp7 family putative phage head morphogenesis protein